MKNFREQGERVKEIPFSSETKVMEVVYQMGSSQVSFVKGALEMVLARCDSYLRHGKIVPLEGSGVPADCGRYSEELGGRGLRVLALARVGPYCAWLAAPELVEAVAEHPQRRERPKLAARR